jgi:hypothetical protein
MLPHHDFILPIPARHRYWLKGQAVYHPSWQPRCNTLVKRKQNILELQRFDISKVGKREAYSAHYMRWKRFDSN